MSSEAERVFLGAKLTITDKRLPLSIDAIEALEFLKSWFWAGIFTQDNLSKALDQVKEAWPVAPSYLYIFCSGFYQFLASTAKKSAFSYQTISQLIWTV